MIGDELEPNDLEWSEPLVYEYAPGSPEAGRYLTSNPEWLQNGTERPSKDGKQWDASSSSSQTPLFFPPDCSDL